VSRDAHLAVTVFTKFEVDTTIRCLVISSLQAAPHHHLLAVTSYRSPCFRQPVARQSSRSTMGNWFGTVLMSQTTEEHLPVVPSSPQKEIMMPLLCYETELIKSVSQRHVTMVPNVGPQQILTELPSMPCI